MPQPVLCRLILSNDRIFLHFAFHFYLTHAWRNILRRSFTGSSSAPGAPRADLGGKLFLVADNKNYC
jgi:hypothetical protein